MTQKEKEIAHEKEFLLSLLEKAAKGQNKKVIVYCILRHVSRSGMYRTIDTFIIVDNEPLRITHSHAKIINARYDTNHDAMGISGCGMDMGSEAVYQLSCALYGIGKHTHEDAYKLSQRWL